MVSQKFAGESSEVGAPFLRIKEVPAAAGVGIVALSAQIDHPDGETFGREVSGERTKIRRGAAQAMNAEDVRLAFSAGCLPDQPGEGRVIMPAPGKLPRSAGEVLVGDGGNHMGDFLRCCGGGQATKRGRLEPEGAARAARLRENHAAICRHLLRSFSACSGCQGRCTLGLMRPVNLAEFEDLARGKLTREAYEYYAGAANDGITLRANREAYERIALHYPVFRDVTVRDSATSVLGEKISFPVMVAPTAFHRLACEQGECATARAAARAGTVMVISTLATTLLEEVTAAADGPTWFQLYIYKDRGATLELVRRAEAAGCRALVLTVDTAVWGRREADVRNNLTPPKGLSVVNLAAQAKQAFPEGVSGSGLAAYTAEMLDASLTWQDLAWLLTQTKLPVLLKGVVRADDAARAVEYGAAGVVVSNHGGRQLDSAPATIEALPRVVEAVAGRVPVLVDGGVRRGTDVVKALALGARAVLIGRPVLWGLAVAGEDGAYRVLELLKAEFDLAMALCGARTVGEVERGLIG